MDISVARRFLASSWTGLAQELRAMSWHGPRAVLCLQTVGSVLLAIVLADALNLADRWWVAISSYVVLRADFSTSLSRALQRLAGTACGALLGFAAGVWVSSSPWLYAVVLGTTATLGLYRAIGSTRSYGWALATITTLLVVSEAPQVPDVAALAVQRFVDVVVGTAASVVVAGMVFGVRRAWERRHPNVVLPPTAEPAPGAAGELKRTAPRMRRLRALQAIQGGVTIAALSVPGWYRQWPDFPQMLVTVAMVLLVPLPALLRRRGEDNVVVLRMANRTLGCLLAAIVALATLPVVGDKPLACLGVLAAGLWLAAHVQAGNAGTSYIGTQFGVAFIIAFVQDHQWSTDAGPAMLRLLGIVAGIAALSMVMLVQSGLRRRW
jgi:uncharacterized membrane protein YccC